MPYVKPGIEVKQVQRSVTPVLLAPELEACVVGDGYWVQDISWDNPQDPLRHSVSQVLLEGSSNVTIPLSGINSQFFDVTGDEQLVHVDLLGVSGSDTGKVKHLTYGSQFSVSNNVLTISGISGNTSKYQIKVGFRAKNPTSKGLKVLDSISDIERTIGSPVSWNPLAFGSYLAMLNSNSKIKILGLERSANPTTHFNESVDNFLNLTEVYAIAPVTHNIDIPYLANHCVTNSLPEIKQERIALVNRIVNYPTNYKALTSTQRNTLASGIRDANSAIQNRRVVSIHPDAAYVVETRHVSTVKPSWIQKSFEYFTTKNFSIHGPYAKLVNDVFVNGVTYKAGTEITEAVWQNLINNDWGGNSGIVTVLAPVPGFYFTAAVAGQVISNSPEQPLTNLPISGFSEVVGSSDVFSEANLNTMAEGGTYIITKQSISGPLVSRHQLTTDITSIAKRELSITKTLDYVAKMLRKVLIPYVGRYAINANFLKLIRSIIFSTGTYLVREEIVNDFKISQVIQDTANPDTILAEVEVLVRYPVNYIKITLVF